MGPSDGIGPFAEAALFPLIADPHHDSPRKLKGVANYLWNSFT